MRSSVVTIVVMLTCALGIVNAQSVGITDWGEDHPEQQPTASWIGSTGLLLTPTAIVGSSVRVTGGYHTIDGDDYDQSVYNANLALTSSIEAGVARIDNVAVRGPLGDEIGDETVFNAKLGLDLVNWFKVLGGPDVAVGAWDIADKVNRTFYVVASKRLELGGKGLLAGCTAHIGFGDTEQNYGALDGLFGGIDFAVMDGALVQVEYDAQDINAAIRYYPTPQLALDLGILDGDLGWGASFRTAY